MEASAGNYLGWQSWKPVFNAYAMIIHVNSNNVLFDTIKWLTILYILYGMCSCSEEVDQVGWLNEWLCWRWEASGHRFESSKPSPTVVLKWQCNEPENGYYPSNIYLELGLPGNIFNSFPRHIHVLIYNKKTCFGGLSFDSNSAKNVWQSRIDLLYWCCTSTKESSIGMSLLRRPARAWRQLLLNYLHYLKLSAIGSLSSACLIYQQQSNDYHWWSVADAHQPKTWVF